MVGNYSKFQNEGEALTYLKSERQDFIGKKQAQKTPSESLNVSAASRPEVVVAPVTSRLPNTLNLTPVSPVSPILGVPRLRT